MSKTKEIKIKVEGKEWKEAIDKAFKKIEKDIKIDGFRKGHAPKDIILKKYGEANIWLDAADLVIEDAYKKMVEENKDEEIVTRPDAQIGAITGEYVEFIFTLTLRPEIKLGEYLKLGHGEWVTGGGKRDSILSDAFEAVIGAIYLDGGLNPAREFILQYVLSDIEKKQLFYDSKTILQEIIQSKFHEKTNLSYALEKEEGPDHNKSFDVVCMVNEKAYGRGKGRTKKAAEQKAAYETILLLRQEK